MMLHKYIARIITTMTLIAWSKGRIPDPGPIRRRSENDVRSESMTRLMFDGTLRQSLGFQLVRDNIVDNTVCSPLGVMIPLATIAKGSNSTTLDEILMVLGFPDQSNIKDYMPTVMEYLAASLPGVEILVSNKILLVDKDLYFKFEPAIEKTTFRNILSFNLVIRRETHARIRNFLKEGEVTPGMSLVIASGVYVRVHWAESFQNVGMRPFQSQFTTVNQPTMKGQVISFYKSMESLGAEMLQIPCSGEGVLSMIIILPNVGRDLLDVVSQLELKPDLLNNALGSALPVLANVTMPKFSIKSSFNLEHSLRSLNLNRVFIKAMSDIVGITRHEKLSIGLFKHIAYIELVERGIDGEIGNLTYLGVSRRNQLKTINFEVARPFYFVLNYHSEQLMAGSFVGSEIIIKDSSMPSEDFPQQSNRTKKPLLPIPPDHPIMKALSKPFDKIRHEDMFRKVPDTRRNDRPIVRPRSQPIDKIRPGEEPSVTIPSTPVGGKTTTLSTELLESILSPTHEKFIYGSKLNSDMNLHNFPELPYNPYDKLAPDNPMSPHEVSFGDNLANLSRSPRDSPISPHDEPYNENQPKFPKSALSGPKSQPDYSYDDKNPNLPKTSFDDPISPRDDPYGGIRPHLPMASDDSPYRIPPNHPIPPPGIPYDRLPASQHDNKHDKKYPDHYMILHSNQHDRIPPRHPTQSRGNQYGRKSPSYPVLPGGQQYDRLSLGANPERRLHTNHPTAQTGNHNVRKPPSHPMSPHSNTYNRKLSYVPISKKLPPKYPIPPRVKTHDRIKTKEQLPPQRGKPADVVPPKRPVPAHAIPYDRIPPNDSVLNGGKPNNSTLNKNARKTNKTGGKPNSRRAEPNEDDMHFFAFDPDKPQESFFVADIADQPFSPDTSYLKTSKNDAPHDSSVEEEHGGDATGPHGTPPGKEDQEAKNKPFNNKPSGTKQREHFGANKGDDQILHTLVKAMNIKEMWKR